jgi:hypothetical protein
MSHLHYLDFDFSDEDSGRGSFDAMASVLPYRVAAVLDEMAAVLQWAVVSFGPAGRLHDDGDWDYELQGTIEPDTPVPVKYDEASGVVYLPPANVSSRVTLSLTLTGSRAFCEAFNERFEPGE